MQVIDTLAINQEINNREDVLELVGKAVSYFPSLTWDGIQFTGTIRLPYDKKVQIGFNTYYGFMFSRLMKELRRYKKENMVIGLTSAPVIKLESCIDKEKIKTEIRLVYDYILDDVGFVSSFMIEDKIVSKVIAHALGHSRNLRHHNLPIDFMYEYLLKNRQAQNLDKLCGKCIETLENGTKR